MDARPPPWSRPALVLVIYLGLGAVALLWATLRGHPNLWRIAGHANVRAWSGIGLGLLCGLSIVALSQLATHRFEWARQLHRDFRSLLGPLPDLEITVLATASSLGEEMFFRGALMQALDSVTGPTWALWLSSAVFALLHVGPRARYLPWTVSSLGAGLLFGGLFQWSGDLTGPVLAHFTVNFLNLRHVSRYDLPR